MGKSRPRLSSSRSTPPRRARSRAPTWWPSSRVAKLYEKAKNPKMARKIRRADPAALPPHPPQADPRGDGSGGARELSAEPGYLRRLRPQSSCGSQRPSSPSPSRQGGAPWSRCSGSIPRRSPWARRPCHGPLADRARLPEHGGIADRAPVPPQFQSDSRLLQAYEKSSAAGGPGRSQGQGAVPERAGEIARARHLQRLRGPLAGGTRQGRPQGLRRIGGGAGAGRDLRGRPGARPRRIRSRRSGRTTPR